MELSWRTLLIFVVLVLIVIVVIDGLRRMRSNKQPMTDFDLNKEFDFPDEPKVQSQASDFIPPEESEPHFMPDSHTDNPAAQPVNEPSLSQEVAHTQDDDDAPSLAAVTHTDATQQHSDDDLEFLDASTSEALKALSEQLKSANQAVQSAQPSQSEETLDIDALAASDDVSIIGADPISDEELETRRQRFAAEQAQWDVQCEQLAQELDQVSQTLQHEPQADAIESESESGDENPLPSTTLDASSPVSTLSYPVNLAGEEAENLAQRPQADVILVLHVLARSPQGFAGEQLVNIFNQCDMRFGEMRIFHRFEEAHGAGCIQFSIAQSHEPGLFDPQNMTHSHYSGLTFFMSLPGATQPLLAYKAMSEMAQFVAQYLDGELLDDTRSAFTQQTCEHQREQIIEYQHQQTLNQLKETT